MVTDKNGKTKCTGKGTYYLRNGTAIKGTWKDNKLIKAEDSTQKFYVKDKKEICRLPQVPVNIINKVSPQVTALGKIFSVP